MLGFCEVKTTQEMDSISSHMDDFHGQFMRKSFKQSGQYGVKSSHEKVNLRKKGYLQKDDGFHREFSHLRNLKQIEGKCKETVFIHKVNIAMT